MVLANRTPQKQYWRALAEVGAKIGTQVELMTEAEANVSKDFNEQDSRRG
jgi:hypothetical protein